MLASLSIPYNRADHEYSSSGRKALADSQEGKTWTEVAQGLDCKCERGTRTGLSRGGRMDSGLWHLCFSQSYCQFSACPPCTWVCEHMYTATGVQNPVENAGKQSAPTAMESCAHPRWLIGFLEYLPLKTFILKHLFLQRNLSFSYFIMNSHIMHICTIVYIKLYI